MKYFRLIWAGLWRKKARTILTLLSVTTAFFLFGMLQGFNLGIDSLTARYTDTTRLRVTNRINRNDPMPISYVARIAGLHGIARATPISALVGTYQQPGNVLVSVAVDTDSWYKIYPEFRTPPEQLAAMRNKRDGVLVGAALVERFGWKVGDRIPLESINVMNGNGRKWEFTIVGIYDIDGAHNFATNILVNYDYLNEARTAQRNTTDQIVLRLVDASRNAEVAGAIDELFANSPNQTMTQNERDFIQSSLSQIGDINFFVNGIVGAVLFALLFLTGNTMMQSIRERTPEIAVLKTIGFSNDTILMLVLIESFFLSAVAATLGLLLASIAFPVLMQRIGAAIGGLEGLRVPFSVFAWGLGIAAALAIASGMPPALRAKRLQIADALANR